MQADLHGGHHAARCSTVFSTCVPGFSTDSWKISAVIGLDPTTPASSSARKVFTFYPIYCHLSQSICEVCSCVDGQRLLNCCHIFKSSPGSQSISLLGVFLLDVLLGNNWALRLVPHLPLLKQTKSESWKSLENLIKRSPSPPSPGPSPPSVQLLDAAESPLCLLLPFPRSFNSWRKFVRQRT